MQKGEDKMVIKNALGIGAHFDDVDLGCGGTLARIVKEGGNSYKLTLTDNVTAFKWEKINVDFDSSRQDSSLACECLGIEEVQNFEYEKCNYLQYSTALMQRIESFIYQNNIDTVFLHYNSDFNQDHIAASQLSLTAARHVKNILYYQSNGYILESAFYPTVFFDITDVYEDKVNALNQYHGDHNRFNRLFDVTLKRNEIWGYANKVKYAEGFVPVKVCL